MKMRINELIKKINLEMLYYLFYKDLKFIKNIKLKRFLSIKML